MKFSTKGFFSRSDQIRRKHLCGVVLVNPQIWFCGSRSSGAAAVHVLYRGSALLGGGRLWHRCFPMNFAKFLGVSFFMGRFWCLLLVSGFHLAGIGMPPAVVSPWYWSVLWCGICNLGVWGLVGCVQSRGLGAYASHLPNFILLISFSDTLLVVSILDIVYDCHLWLLLQSGRG